MKSAINFRAAYMHVFNNGSRILCLVCVAWAISLKLSASNLGGSGFKSPEEAVAALQQAVSAHDQARLKSIFGPEVTNLVNPDLVEATNEFAAVAAALSESKRIVPRGEGEAMLEYGTDKSIFPVPIVRKDNQWYFDTVAGMEEVINRRIGRNELEVLDVIRTYVQAQREYASADRDDDEVLEYAQRFGSTPRKKDGLYWRPDLDGTISPLGPLAAEAEAAGYSKTDDGDRQPFRGYYFKILTQQGKNAPGGGYDYIINGNMIGGFGLVAWPSEYGETGVMTFVVNQQGRVYQKDFESKTATVAESMESYDPDQSWSLSAD